MTTPERGRRWILHAGFVACALLVCLPQRSPGQLPQTASDDRCLNCHGQKHITTISREERATMVVPEPGIPDRKNTTSLFIDQNALLQSVHSRVACGECHRETEELPHSARLPEPQCISCHQEQAEDVSRSRHAKVVRRTEPMAPRCWDCHGTHEIRLQSKVNPMEKIKICASCHQKYLGNMAGLANGGVLVRSYLDSVHGRVRKPGTTEVGATCIDCHGNHEILPAQDGRSRVHRSNIPDTCGRCHPESRKEFEATVHADVGRRHDPSIRAALCSDCHTAHSITRTGTPEFMQDIVSECGSCHRDLYRTYRETYHGQVQQLGSVRVAKCSDCHGAHNIRRPTDPKSQLSSANRVSTCARCHKEIQSMSASGRVNFIAYHPHADFRNGSQHPGLFLTWRIAVVCCAVLLAVFSLHWVAWIRKTLRKKQVAPGEEVMAIVRFDNMQRWTHLVALICVLGLTLTGLPLKFSRHPWVVALMVLFGKPDRAGLVHRTFAVLLVGTILFHAATVFKARKKRKMPLRARISGPDSLLPSGRDLRQFKDAFRWFAGRGPRPDLDRWCYREKLDYWAIVIAMGALAASGMFLWFPTFFARFLPGYWFNLAMVIHGYAGLLTLGCVLMVHLFNTSLRRESFPVNDVIFTGQLSEEEFRAERPAHYARMAETNALDGLKATPASARERKIFYYAALASQILGIVLFILIVCATVW